MAKKREVIALHEVWRVWVGEAPAVRVANESEARALMLREGRDFAEANSFDRPDMACPMVEVLWNEALPEGEACHQTVHSPVITVLRRGQLRRVVNHLSPSKFEGKARGWYALEPRLPAWWPRQYLAGVADPDTLVARGASSWLAQIDARWPAH